MQYVRGDGIFDVWRIVGWFTAKSTLFWFLCHPI